MFKVFNKTYQPIILMDGTRIHARSWITISNMTEQIINLETRGLILVRKM